MDYYADDFNVTEKYFALINPWITSCDALINPWILSSDKFSMWDNILINKKYDRSHYDEAVKKLHKIMVLDKFKSTLTDIDQSKLPNDHFDIVESFL